MRKKKIEEKRKGEDRNKNCLQFCNDKGSCIKDVYVYGFVTAAASF